MNTPGTASSSSDAELRQLTVIVYVLQALSFFVGLTLIAGVVVNYIKRDDVAGTLYESHFRWQIRTFWFSLLWGVIGCVLVLVVIGFAVLVADAIWVIYRIAKGWIRLSEGKPMYAAASAGGQS